MPWDWMKEMGDKIIIFSISSPQGSIIIKMGTTNLLDNLAFNARALTTMRPKARSRAYRKKPSPDIRRYTLIYARYTPDIRHMCAYISVCLAYIRCVFLAAGRISAYIWRISDTFFAPAGPLPDIRRYTPIYGRYKPILVPPSGPSLGWWIFCLLLGMGLMGWSSDFSFRLLKPSNTSVHNLRRKRVYVHRFHTNNVPRGQMHGARCLRPNSGFDPRAWGAEQKELGF